MWEYIKRIFVTKEHDAAMLKIEVAKFHGERAVNNRHSPAQVRRRKRETGERMELIERKNKELAKAIENAGKQQPD